MRVYRHVLDGHLKIMGPDWWYRWRNDRRRRRCAEGKHPRGAIITPGRPGKRFCSACLEIVP